MTTTPTSTTVVEPVVQLMLLVSIRKKFPVTQFDVVDLWVLWYHKKRSKLSVCVAIEEMIAMTTMLPVQVV